MRCGGIRLSRFLDSLEVRREDEDALAGKHGEYDIVLANALPQVQDK